VSEYVILVDEEDRVVGTEEKLRAHLTSARHRAVSVVLCSRDGRMLMQQRSTVKYHSAGLWSNTCCGHPRPGEPSIDAATRRLAEEMGVDCVLIPASRLTYCVNVGGGLVEHELNHVFVGEFDGVPRSNDEEVARWVWADRDLLRDMRRHRADLLTPWFEPVITSLHRWASTATTLPETIREAIVRWE
jgi:isopentenyl-diphosphate Delta-isomerase